MEDKKTKELLDWYQEQAKRTIGDLGEKMNLAHMVLGIGSETEELYKAFINDDKINILEEICDKFWYIANYCTFRGYNLAELYIKRNEFKQEAWELNCEVEVIKYSMLQDCVKKYIAYNKPINKEIEENALKGILWSLEEVAFSENVNLFKGLENNINKLKVRFPDKFNEELALNRDLQKERLELEK